MPALDTRWKVETYELYKDGEISKEAMKKLFGDDFMEIEIIRQNERMFNEEIPEGADIFKS